MRFRNYAVIALTVASAAGAQEQPVVAASKQACLEPAAWYTLDSGTPRRALAETLLRDVAQSQIVLLGEYHDSAEHHAWQLQTLAALHLLRPELVIGFESFPRRVQSVLDRWIAGELNPRQFLGQTDWEKVWNLPPALYQPLFDFARLNRIPMVALNVERTLTEAVTSRGWDAVPAEQKEGLSRPAPPPKAYEDDLYEVFLAHAKDNPKRKAGSRDDPAFRYFVESQTTWDRAMAEALAARARVAAGSTAPLIVGIIGSGHLRHGHGVPHQLRDLGIRNVSTLLPVSPEYCTGLQAGLADAVFAVAAAPEKPPPPPRLGVRLGGEEGRVEIAAVTPGSLAEQSGLRSGDRIIAVADTPVKNAARVVAAVRVQPPGTWLPIRITRGSETLDLVIRFPPAP